MKNAKQKLSIRQRLQQIGKAPLVVIISLLCLSYSDGRAQTQETKKTISETISDGYGQVRVVKTHDTDQSYSIVNENSPEQAEVLDAPNDNTSFTATNNSNSDYSINLGWDYNSDYCNCSQTTTLSVDVTQSGGNDIPSNFLGNDLPSGSSTYKCGPGQSIDMDWSFNFAGERSWSGDGCTVLATCLVSCDCDYSFSGTNVTSSTAAIKNPTSVFSHRRRI